MVDVRQRLQCLYLIDLGLCCRPIVKRLFAPLMRLQAVSVVIYLKLKIFAMIQTTKWFKNVSKIPERAIDSSMTRKEFLNLAVEVNLSNERQGEILKTVKALFDKVEKMEVVLKDINTGEKPKEIVNYKFPIPVKNKVDFDSLEKMLAATDPYNALVRKRIQNALLLYNKVLIR